MLMQRLTSSFKNRNKNASDPKPLASSEYDPNVYSDEEWSDSEFDPVEYDFYADPKSTPASRFNAAPPLPPPMSQTLQQKRARPLPPTPTAQVLQDDNGEGLYMGPADAYRGVGRVDHAPPRPPNNQHGIMPRSNAPQTIGLVQDEGIYMGPGDANPHTRLGNHAPPLPPSRHAPRPPDQEETTVNDSISGIFGFLDAETCSSIVTAEDDKEDYYERIDAVEGFRSNRPPPAGPLSPSIAASLPNLLEARNALRKPSPAGTKPTVAPRPTGQSPPVFPGFPVAKPRIPPQTPPKPAYVQGMRSGGGAENHGVVTGNGSIDDVRARIFAGAKRLPTLPVNNMPKLKSPEMARRNLSPPAPQQGDLNRQIPPTPPPQARKPPWAIQRQAKTPPVIQDLPQQPQPGLFQQRQPQTPPGASNDLYHYHWYHGEIDRANVNERLYSVNQHGAYLVRKSSRGGDTMPYALSILYNDKVWNLHIRLRRDNTYALGTAKDGEMTFPTIPHLVDYHKTIVLILSGSFGGETTLTESPRRLQ